MFLRFLSLFSLLFIVACTPPTATVSDVPLLLRSPAMSEIPASFLIYSPEVMGDLAQAEFQSDGAGHHFLTIVANEKGGKDKLQGYLRLMRLPLFPGHYIAETASAEGSQQFLVKRTARGFAAETIDIKAVLKAQKVPGIRKDTKTKEYRADNIDAVQALFWRALDLSRQGKLPKSTPHEFTIFDLTQDGGRAAYDAARKAEIKRVAREQAEKAARKQRAAAEQERKRKAREAERQRKADAEKKRRKAMVADNNKRFGSWVYRIELDPMTDKKKQYVYGFPEGFSDPDRSPYLRIGCYGASDTYPMGVTFFWGQSLSDVYPRDEIDMARVTVRFDRRTPQEMGWAVSDDWASTYPPNALAGGMSQLSSGIVGMFLPNTTIAKMNSVWSAKDLHRALRSASTATFRGYTRSGRDATYVFDLAGYRDAIRNFEAHCNR